MSTDLVVDEDPSPFSGRPQPERICRPDLPEVEDAVRTVVDRRSSLVVTGGPSAGRTVLLDELARRAEAAGVAVLHLQTRAVDPFTHALPAGRDLQVEGKVGFSALFASAEVGATTSRRQPDLTAALDEARRTSPSGRVLVVADDVQHLSPHHLGGALDAIRDVNRSGPAVSLVVSHPDRPMAQPHHSYLVDLHQVHLGHWGPQTVRDALEPAFIQRAAGDLQADPRVWEAAHLVTGGWPPAVQRFGQELWDAQRDPTVLGSVEAAHAARATYAHVDHTVSKRLTQLSPEGIRYVRCVQEELVERGSASRAAVVEGMGIGAAASEAIEAELRASGLVAVDYVRDEVAFTIPGTSRHLQTHTPAAATPSDADRLARLGLVAPSGLPDGRAGSSSGRAGLSGGSAIGGARALPGGVASRALPAGRGRGFGR